MLDVESTLVSSKLMATLATLAIYEHHDPTSEQHFDWLYSNDIVH